MFKRLGIATVLCAFTAVAGYFGRPVIEGQPMPPIQPLQPAGGIVRTDPNRDTVRSDSDRSRRRDRSARVRAHRGKRIGLLDRERQRRRQEDRPRLPGQEARPCPAAAARYRGDPQVGIAARSHWKVLHDAR